MYDKTGKLYGPLGIIAPVVMRAKLFHRELKLREIGIKEFIPMEMQKEWEKFVKELKFIDGMKVNR